MHGLDRRTFDLQLGDPFATDAFQEKTAVRAGRDRQDAGWAREIQHRIDQNGRVDPVDILVFFDRLQPVIQRPLDRRANLDNLHHHAGHGPTFQIDDPAGDRYVVAGQSQGQLGGIDGIVRRMGPVGSGGDGLAAARMIVGRSYPTANAYGSDRARIVLKDQGASE